MSECRFASLRVGGRLLYQGLSLTCSKCEAQITIQYATCIFRGHVSEAGMTMDKVELDPAGTCPKCQAPLIYVLFPCVDDVIDLIQVETGVWGLKSLNGKK